MLRPEPITLGSAADGKDITFDAVVEEFLFAGNAVKYLLRLGSGTSIKARVQATQHTNTLRAGDVIKIGWDKADMLAVEVD
jgi:hypothetical protein